MIEAMILSMASFSGDVDQVCNKNVYEIEKFTRKIGLSEIWDRENGKKIDDFYLKISNEDVPKDRYAVYVATIDGSYHKRYECNEFYCTAKDTFEWIASCTNISGKPCLGVAIKTKSDLYCLFRPSPSDYKFSGDD